MKKLKVLLLGLLTFVLVGCTSGLSAYAIAVKNGFEGTEEEWLASLKGADGKDGKDGKDGADGKDATSENAIINIIKDGINYTIYFSNSTTYSFTSESKETAFTTCVSKGYDKSFEVFSATLIELNKEPSSSGVNQDLFNSCIKKTVSITAFDSETSETGSSGSGVIYELDKNTGIAYIITNYHVVYSATAKSISPAINVYQFGQEILAKGMKAEYIAGSMNYDLALIKVTNNALKTSFLEAAKINTEPAYVGQTVVACGNPQGGGISVSTGLVTLESCDITLKGADDTTDVTLRVLRTDTPINPGNSGGGLFNTDGELIGIVNAKSVSESADNIGYAIPSYNVLSCVKNFLDFAATPKYVDGLFRPLLGITIRLNNKTSYFDDKTNMFVSEHEIIVYEINDTSIAKGKLQLNDIINSFTCIRNGQEVFSIEVKRIYNMTEGFMNLRPNDVVKINVTRDGNPVVVEFTITAELFKVFA